jgi:HlyD family secretion protein
MSASVLSLLRKAARPAARRLKARGALVAGVVGSLLLVAWILSSALSSRKPGDYPVRRGTLEPTVPVAGTLVPARSDSYGASVPGVELKILWLVEEGTLVSPGDRLIQFDPAPFQRELDTARARAKELSGEADQSRLALEALKLKTAVDLQEKRASAETTQRDLSALVNTAAPLSAAESANEIETRERILREAETKLSGLEPFVADGYISQEEYRAAQTRRDQAAADLRLARAKHSALVHQTNPDLIKKKLDQAESVKTELKMEQTKSRVEIAQAEAAARVGAARLEEANRQIDEAERKIRACRVMAQGSGLAVHSEVFEKSGERRKVRVGDAVWGGTTVVTLPDLSRMIVEGRVPESEIHRLFPGERASVRLDAFPGLALSGSLRSIGSVGGGSDRNESRSFPVTIALEKSDARFRPGMIARCQIACGRVENALYVPVEAVRSDESGSYALVVSSLGNLSRRKIRTGVGTSQFVQVREGLKEGEVVRVGAE